VPLDWIPPFKIMDTVRNITAVCHRVRWVRNYIVSVKAVTSVNVDVTIDVQLEFEFGVLLLIPTVPSDVILIRSSAELAPLLSV